MRESLISGGRHAYIAPMFSTFWQLLCKHVSTSQDCAEDLVSDMGSNDGFFVLGLLVSPARWGVACRSWSAGPAIHRRFNVVECVGNQALCQHSVGEREGSEHDLARSIVEVCISYEGAEA